MADDCCIDCGVPLEDRERRRCRACLLDLHADEERALLEDDKIERAGLHLQNGRWVP